MRICAIGLRGIPDVMGGIETHCEQLYPRLASMDTTFDITVIGRAGYVSPGRFGNVRVVSVWAPRRKALETLIHTPLALLYARLFLHPHVVHLHAIGPGFFAPLARLLGFRVLATHHATDYDRPKWGRFGRWFLKTGERMIARFASDVVCVSGSIEASLAAEYPERKDRYCTIRNGVSTEAKPAAADNILEKLGVTPRGYILAVGRLDATKGFHELVRAFKSATPNGLKLVIAGGGPDGDPYAAELKRQASPDIVFAFTGHRLRRGLAGRVGAHALCKRRLVCAPIPHGRLRTGRSRSDSRRCTAPGFPHCPASRALAGSGLLLRGRFGGRTFRTACDRRLRASAPGATDGNTCRGQLGPDRRAPPRHPDQPRSAAAPETTCSGGAGSFDPRTLTTSCASTLSNTLQNSAAMFSMRKSFIRRRAASE